MIVVMFHGYTPFHIANILVHIMAGVVAVVCGTTAIVSAKGGRVHVRAGKFFMYAYSALVITAVVGVVVFEFRSFLAVATIASSYDVFAGFRALQLRGRRPQPIDIILSVIALMAPVAFALAIRALHKPWSPALTWSILGGLMALLHMTFSELCCRNPGFDACGFGNICTRCLPLILRRLQPPGRLSSRASPHGLPSPL